MRIVLGSDGSVELTRGERITRGQDLSRRIYVEWNENESPIDTGQILADNMAVQLCITRPDGEQSGWYSMIKIDAEDKYYYTLQAWDTAVAGIATVQVRWYDIELVETDIRTDICEECGNQKLESGRPKYVSDEASFIVDNGKIAQPLNISSENYNEIVLQFITPLSAQAFRKYNINALPDTVAYEPDGAKTAPALFYNFTHDVVDVVPSVLKQGTSYERVKNTCDGFLLVDRKGALQTEVFFTSIGKIYIRSFSGLIASEFKDVVEHSLYVSSYDHQITFEFNGAEDNDEFEAILGSSNGKITLTTPNKTGFTSFEEIRSYLKVGQKIDWGYFDKDGIWRDYGKAFWEITEINDTNFTITDTDNDGTYLIVTMIDIVDTVGTENISPIISTSVNSGSNISNIEVDSELSGESENPVQNKVINEALEGKLDKVAYTNNTSLVYTNDGVLRYLGKNSNDYEPYNIPMIYGSAAGESKPGKGYLITNTPENAYHCANKTYVDGKVKRYKHSLEGILVSDEIPGEETKAIWFTADILSRQSTSFTENNVPFIKGQNIIDNDSFTAVIIIASVVYDGKVWIDLPDADYGARRYYIDESDEVIPFSDTVSEYEE